MIVFGDRAFMEVIRVRGGIRVELLSHRPGVLIGIARDTRDLCLPAHTGKAM